MNNTTNNTQEIDNVLSVNNFTKGEWMTDGDEVYNQFNTIASINTTSKGISEEEAEANAKLIAAAPDLLEALKLIKDCLQSWNSKGTYSNLINHAETFINKATL